MGPGTGADGPHRQHRPHRHGPGRRCVRHHRRPHRPQEGLHHYGLIVQHCFGLLRLVLELSIPARLPLPRRLRPGWRTARSGDARFRICAVPRTGPLHCPLGKFLGPRLDCSSLHRLFLHSPLWLAHGLPHRRPAGTLCLPDPPAYARIVPLPAGSWPRRRSPADRRLPGAAAARTRSALRQRKGNRAGRRQGFVPGIVEKALCVADDHALAGLVRHQLQLLRHLHVAAFAGLPAGLYRRQDL